MINIAHGRALAALAHLEEDGGCVRGDDRRGNGPEEIIALSVEYNIRSGESILSIKRV